MSREFLDGRIEVTYPSMGTFVVEEISVICPKCGAWTDSVTTGPQFVTYQHERAGQTDEIECTIGLDIVPHPFDPPKNRELYLDPWQAWLDSQPDEGDPEHA